VRIKRRKKPAFLSILVVSADNGLVKALFKSPFQRPTYKHIAVQAIDTNGDGVSDAVKLTAMKGRRKHVARVFSV